MPKRLANVHVGYDLQYTYVKKNTTICKICAALFDNKLRRTFMVCAQSTGILNCGAFAARAAIFAKRTAFSRQKAPQSGKRYRSLCIAALYKTVHCGTAIKVRHFWWEKSDAHAAMFSSAAATRLLHSF